MQNVNNLQGECTICMQILTINKLINTIFFRTHRKVVRKKREKYVASFTKKTLQTAIEVIQNEKNFIPKS